MQILSMTATYGKLQNQTLRLEPGMNIIEAPNEWGKSTWCAFLVAMLYGVDTKERTNKDGLADKEHYKPWSGTPMSGSMDINWNGRNITIQRQSKGRTPMGEFYAYETDSGLTVKELTGENCGQMLLGVERSVFQRSAFLRFSDLPVEQDDALRRRLNALVTTGDESGTAQMLGQKLKTLKNKCRHNRTGLLPQAEARRNELQRALTQQEDLLAQLGRNQQRQTQLENWISDLNNHKAALAYTASQEDLGKISQAENAVLQARQALEGLENQCKALPQPWESQAALAALGNLRRDWDSLQMEEQMLPPAPTVPQAPAVFTGITPEEALQQAKADQALAQAPLPRKASPVLLILGLIGVAAGIGLGFVLLALGIGLAVLGAALSILGIVTSGKKNGLLAAETAKRQALAAKYGLADPASWVAMAQAYVDDWANYRQAMHEHSLCRGDLDSRKQAMAQEVEKWGDLTDAAEHHKKAIALWDAKDNAARQLRQQTEHLDALRSMVRTVQAPQRPDSMEYTEAETDRLLSDATYELRQIHQKLGQLQGQTTALGGRETMQQELAQLNKRIEKLEQTYAALDYAQEALANATEQLQRRFAPRITLQAKELFSQLTGGRYNQLQLDEDLTMRTGTEGEAILRTAQWRSDGTVDQLYLALRLAVAKELTPQAPLVLDDALVRFDDIRLKSAISILLQEANNRQILLFTCQNREKAVLEGCPSAADVCLS